MSEQERRLAALSPAKRALLERMLAERGGGASAPLAIPPRNAGDERLSFAEQRLWFVGQLEPDNPFYIMPLAAWLHGPLDRDAFAHAWQELAARHESLRTTYLRSPEGEPVRVVHERLSPELTWADGSEHHVEAGTPFAELPEALASELRVAARRPCSLERGPLLRGHLYRLSADRHLILLVMHHIVSDGWSMATMIGELAELYAAAVARRPSRLPPLPIQYADFAAWQRDRLQGTRLREQLDYWEQRLRGAPAELPLLTDRPRPAVQDFHGALVPLELPRELSARVRALATRHQATPFMVLLAGYAALLARRGREREFCIGSAVANRTAPELERLIGFFVNTLVLRCELGDDPTFEHWLQRLRTVALEAFDHQELPFERLVESLAPGRDRSHSPLFQTALVLQNMPRRLDTAAGLRIEPLAIDNGTAKFDLTVLLNDEGTGDDSPFHGHIEYRTTLFDRPTVERLARGYLALLAAATADPTARVSTLPAMDDEERRQAAAIGVGETRPLPLPWRLPDVVWAHAERSPDQTAISCQNRVTTYAALRDRARRVAAALRRRGLEPERPVLVCLPRGDQQVVAMLGVMEAGGAYVPLDVDQPIERAALVAADAAPLILIGDDATIARLQRLPVPTATLDELESLCGEADALPGISHAAARDGTADAPEEAGGAALAYVIYTSGSTGEPKGVEVEHRSIVNFAHAQAEVLDVGPASRVLHSLSPSFDGGLSEVVLALCAGASLVIADQDESRDPDRLAELLRRERVTVAKFPPARLAMLDPGQLPELRTVSTGGDTLTGELARRWLDGRRMFNGYGPTEATVGVSMHELREPLVDRPPIGRALTNMWAYVLDELGQPAPLGVPGEIAIGGLGVARGYRQRPAETRSRFVEDPCRQGERIYLTGDLGRWNTQGELEFLGRVDRQVKIRGHRVEPDEVAAALGRLPDVAQAAVTVREDSQSGAALVAYVVPESSDAHLGGEQSEHVDHWLALFEQTHRAAGPALDPEFNITGWVSSYTGQPIPADEMRRWCDRAAERMLALRPRRVLEVGCGTGLVLFRVAPHCDSYVGVDFLRMSLDQVRSTLEQSRHAMLRERVRLVELRADEVDRLDEALGSERDSTYDLVVLNSVAQYFPSVDYLLRVLDQVSRRVAPGGAVFLGDIRHAGLHGALAASIELSRADEEARAAELARRARSRVEHEEELLVDPEFWRSLRSKLPRVVAVETLLKAGAEANELIRFRYDVVLHFDAAPTLPPREEWDAARGTPTPGELVAHLESTTSSGVVVRGLSNRRVAGDAWLWRRLAAGVDSTAAELRTGERAVVDEASDPQDFFALAETGRWEVRVHCGAAPETFDVELCSAGDADALTAPPAIQGTGAASASTPAGGISRPAHRVDWRQWTNDPLADKVAGRLVTRLRSELRDRLPDYMLPAAYVVLDELPRTLQGKVDLRALPPPTSLRPAWADDYQSPADEQERLVADVWEQLLGMSPVGATDDFFRLGGHSLLAVRVMAEIERRTGRRLPLGALFHDATVRHLAKLLREPERAESSSLVPLHPGPRDVQRAPLFCIHPAGGTVFCYRDLARRLGRRRAVFGVQAVGLDGRRPPHDDMRSMAEHYADVIQQAHPGPYHLCGWSLGGNIAYEVARTLAARGANLGVLALFDSGAVPDEGALQETDFLALVMALFPGEEHLSLDELRALPPLDQVQYFAERAVRAGLLPADDPEAAQHVFHVFRANIKAVHTHHTGDFTGRVVLFRPGQQERTNALFDDPQLGWAAHVPGGVEVVTSAGDHSRMVYEPHIEGLAAELDRRLDA